MNEEVSKQPESTTEKIESKERKPLPVHEDEDDDDEDEFEFEKEDIWSNTFIYLWREPIYL